MSSEGELKGFRRPLEVDKHEHFMALCIRRIPEPTRRDFVKLANEEFSGDYGMCLKHLLDFFTGMMPPKDSALLEALNALDQRVSKLEAKSDEKKVRMANGREL